MNVSHFACGSQRFASVQSATAAPQASLFFVGLSTNPAPHVHVSHFTKSHLCWSAHDAKALCSYLASQTEHVGPVHESVHEQRHVGCGLAAVAGNGVVTDLPWPVQWASLVHRVHVGKSL